MRWIRQEVQYINWLKISDEMISIKTERMASLRVCRCCLSTNGGALRLVKSSTDILELLLGMQLDLAELWLCYRCSHTMRKICLFRDLCFRAHAVLQEYSTIQDGDKARNYFRGEKETFSWGRKPEPSMSNTLCMSIITEGLKSSVNFKSFNKDGKQPKNCFDSIAAFHEIISQDNVKLDPEADTRLSWLDNLRNDNVTEYSEDLAEEKFIPELVNNAEKSETLIKPTCKMEDKEVINPFPFYESPDQPSSPDSAHEPLSKIKKLSKIRKRKTRRCKKIKKEESNTYKKSRVRSVVPKVISEEVDRVCGVHLTLEEQIKEMQERAKDKSFLQATYKCELCVVKFYSQLAMDNHRKKHLPSRGPHACPVCTQHFPNPDYLRTHRECHSMRLTCHLCDKRFYYKKTFRNHLVWHTGELKCLVCGESLSNKKALKEHMINTHGSSPDPGYECDTCGKMISTKTLLKIHILRHRGIPTHTCAVCSKGFYSDVALSIHMESHKEKTLHEHYCVQCDRHFKTLNTLNTHFKYSAAHRDPATLKFKCPECSMAFYCRKLLTQHTAARHGGGVRYVCDACGVSYVSRSTLLRHVKCVHEGYQLPKKFACPTCGKAFAAKFVLEKHIRIHTGERPFKCQQCPDTFRQDSALSTHVKLVHLKLKRNVKRL